MTPLSRGDRAFWRPGGAPAEQVAAARGPAPASHTAASPRVSGSLPSHYAPQARVEIVATDRLQSRAAEVLAAGQKIAVLCQSPPDFDVANRNIHLLKLPQASEEYAHPLYAL